MLVEVLFQNILSHKGKLRWCVREESVNDVDNGWSFFSDIDTEEYLSKADNMCICDFNTVANIEPAIITIYNCKVGTDIELVEEQIESIIQEVQRNMNENTVQIVFE